MKRALLALPFCIALLHSHAAEEPLIPTALNAVLPKIHAGMSIHEVETALAAAYPNVKGRMASWSGQTGYIAYKLDERYSLSVSSIARNGKEVVHAEMRLYLIDWPAKRRVDLKVHDRETQPDVESPNR